MATNANLPSNWDQYFDPSAFNAPAGAGQPKSSGSSLGGSLLDWSPGNIFGNISAIFGGGDPSFKPYIDANGNYVFGPPNKVNPVPVTQVPGAKLKPNKTYTDMANNISALSTLFPQFASIIAGQAIPQAQAQLSGAQATAPGYEALARQNELAQGSTDAAALEQANSTLLPAALEGQKTLDPEYYATRALTAQKLAEQLNGIGPTVSREIGQGLAQTDSQHGVASAPSQLNTVSNAMQYGKAGQDALTSAIQAATTAMPALRSGQDAFSMTTGRSSSANPTTGTAGLASSASLGSGMGNNLASAQQANNLNATNTALNSKDWADYLGQVTSSIGNLTSSAGGIAGMACWIARRVYGVNNPRWTLFRNYLLNEAPDWFREFYLRNGERIASMMSDADCALVQPLMDNLIGDK